MVSLDVNALSATISTVVAQAVQSALSQDHFAAILTPRTTDGLGCIVQAVATATDANVVASGSSGGANAAVVGIINKQASKDKAIIVLLRDLVLICLKRHILFQARHIPGFLNSRADCLPRSHRTQTNFQLTYLYPGT